MKVKKILSSARCGAARGGEGEEEGSEEGESMRGGGNSSSASDGSIDRAQSRCIGV